jgi:hypothetical protein
VAESPIPEPALDKKSNPERLARLPQTALDGISPDYTSPEIGAKRANVWEQPGIDILTQLKQGITIQKCRINYVARYDSIDFFHRAKIIKILDINLIFYNN